MQIVHIAFVIVFLFNKRYFSPIQNIIVKHLSFLIAV